MHQPRSFLLSQNHEVQELIPPREATKLLEPKFCACDEWGLAVVQVAERERDRDLGAQTDAAKSMAGGQKAIGRWRIDLRGFTSPSPSPRYILITILGGTPQNNFVTSFSSFPQCPSLIVFFRTTLVSALLYLSSKVHVFLLCSSPCLSFLPSLVFVPLYDASTCLHFFLNLSSS